MREELLTEALITLTFAAVGFVFREARAARLATIRLESLVEQVKDHESRIRDLERGGNHVRRTGSAAAKA